jgi:hypothetical protein
MGFFEKQPPIEAIIKKAQTSQLKDKKSHQN